MNKGFVVILATLLVLSAGLVIVLSAGYISLNNVKIVRNNIYSVQAYYAAEAGIEDSLLRLNKDMNFSKTNNFTVGDGTATIEIADPIGGSRTIISSGNIKNRIRKIRAIRAITTEEVNFHYGAQVGDGGMIMENNSKIQGNVFSNGDVIGAGIIAGAVKVAGDNKIQDLSINGDAYAYNCYDCTIGGTLYYWGSNSNCGQEGILSDPVLSRSLPISQETIAAWQNEASCNNDPGCVHGDNYIVPQNTTVYLGPQKIEGDLILENNAVLVITGVIWVAGNGATTEGNILPGQNAEIRLDSDYGSISGIVLADGKIKVENDVRLAGSGIEGSYIMLLSTNDSKDDPDNPAIDVVNNAEGAILYAANGMLRLRSNVKIREGTAYQIYLDNDALIEYESGLKDTFFSTGPGGSWEILEWKEVE